MGSRNAQTVVTLGSEEERIVDTFLQKNGIKGRAAAIRQMIISWGKVSATRENWRRKKRQRCIRLQKDIP